MLFEILQVNQQFKIRSVDLHQGKLRRQIVKLTNEPCWNFTHFMRVVLFELVKYCGHWIPKLAWLPDYLDIFSRHSRVKPTALASCKDENDALVWILSEQVPGDNRVNNHLETDTACRVNYVNKRVKFIALHWLSALDPHSCRKIWITEARCVHDCQIFYDLAFVHIRCLCASHSCVTRLGDIVSNESVDHRRFTNAHLTHHNDSFFVSSQHL